MKGANQPTFCILDCDTVSIIRILIHDEIDEFCGCFLTGRTQMSIQRLERESRTNERLELDLVIGTE